MPVQRVTKRRKPSSGLAAPPSAPSGAQPHSPAPTETRKETAQQQQQQKQPDDKGAPNVEETPAPLNLSTQKDLQVPKEPKELKKQDEPNEPSESTTTAQAAPVAGNASASTARPSTIRLERRCSNTNTRLHGIMLCAAALVYVLCIGWFCTVMVRATRAQERMDQAAFMLYRVIGRLEGRLDGGRGDGGRLEGRLDGLESGRLDNQLESRDPRASGRWNAEEDGVFGHGRRGVDLLSRPSRL